MRIIGIQVENFRKLRNAVSLQNLGTGLTVIAGSNEDGKSTLLEAVRCALFQKHTLTGEHAESLQPHNSTVRPQVTVEFEMDGQHYTIKKSFCQRSEALLTTPTGSFSGAAAEDKLQELLKFRRPSRGATSENEQGIWGLLWVTQGSAFSPLVLNDGARSSIQSAIEMQVGQVLGGRRGEHLLAAIDAEYQTFFTPTGRLTGQYQQAQRCADQLREEMDRTASELGVYELDLQDLERIEARLLRWEAENTLAELGLKHEQAKQARTSLDELLKQQQSAAQELKVAVAQRQLALGKHEARGKDRQRVSEEETALGRTMDRLATAVRSLEPLRSNETEAQRQREKLSEAHSALDEQLREIERTIEYLRATANLSELTRRFEQAKPAKHEVEQINISLQLLTADKKLISKLESLEVEVNDARTRLDVIATSIEVNMPGASIATLDGQAIGNFWTGRLTRKAELNIEGVATIAIVPGGSTQDFHLEFDRHHKALQEALAKYGWGTIEDARQQLARKLKLETDLKLQTVILEAQAPNGLENLRLEIARLEEQVKGTSPNPLASYTIDDLIGERQRLQKQLRAAADQLRLKDEELKLKCKTVQEQEKVVATLESEQHRLATLVTQLKEHLMQARRNETDDLLASSCYAMQRIHDELQEVGARLAIQVREKNPELIELALEQAHQAFQHFSAEIGNARSRAHDTRIALSAKGQLGLGEKLELLQGQLALAEAECNRCKRRADAIALLRSTMQESERRAKEQYLLPVTERIQPYLEILLPGTELTMTEGMEVTGLRRNGVNEPFSSLSLGTREQIAVIVRLAFADLLHAYGQPVAVVLDDAIAYADADRLDRMLLVLRRAAKRSQILVLTCRERDYECAGAPIIRLPDCAGQLSSLVA